MRKLLAFEKQLVLAEVKGKREVIMGVGTILKENENNDNGQTLKLVAEYLVKIGKEIIV